LSLARRPARLVDLGRRDYAETLALQRELVAERQAGGGADVLLLVEHPEVITVGRRAGSRDNVLDDRLPVVEVERGGDATYHGPGQLVGYPILALDAGERDLHRYLRALEEGLIAACAEVGVAAGRNPGWTGVWVAFDDGPRKVASIGIAVRRWVTLHGFALNVATDLARFAALRPCGLDPQVMTSLSAELGRPVALDELKPIVARTVGAALGRDFRVAP
jgi:lipoyl(octanoyl) transferase